MSLLNVISSKCVVNDRTATVKSKEAVAVTAVHADAADANIGADADAVAEVSGDAAAKASHLARAVYYIRREGATAITCRRTSDIGTLPTFFGKTTAGQEIAIDAFTYKDSHDRGDSVYDGRKLTEL